MTALGKIMIVAGLALAASGLLVWMLAALPGAADFKLGQLPGDIHLRRGNFSFYFPLTSAIVISVGLSLLLALLRR